MSTTNILAEIIVVGSFSLLWIIPIFFTFLDNIWIQNLIKLNIQSTVLFLAILYFLGTLSNFIADKLFFLIDKLIVKKYEGKSHIRKIRTKIIVSSSDATNYLFQRRSFVRIFRANSMNCFIGAIVIYYNIGNLTRILPFDKNNLAVFLFVISVFSFWAYIVTLSGYFSFIIETGEILNGNNG